MSAVNEPSFIPRPQGPGAGPGAQAGRGLPTLARGALATHSPDRALAMLLAATRVQTLAGSRALTSASGFYFRCDGRLFLATSRHVFFDGPSGHMPDRVEVACHTDVDDLRRIQRLELPLYANGLALWRQGQDGGGSIDVAVLEIPAAELPQPNALHAFGPDDLATPAMGWTVGHGLVIPGFPLGFHDTVHHLPVVRSAAIASAYGVRFQGKGLFLTDSRTHRGSSGAPVLLHESDTLGRWHWRLLGVHASRMDMSGRDAAQDESLGLNCAWYADVLLALTGDGSPARLERPADALDVR